MPNEISNEFHTIENDIKQFFLKELGKLESGLSTLVSDVKTVVTGVIDQAGPVVVAAASAAVQAILANATGGLSAMATAAEGAAISHLSSQGITLAENALLQLKALVIGNILKAQPAQPAPAAPPQPTTN